jgi:hypothetical protein
MEFAVTPEHMECRLSEGGSRILTARVARRGLTKRDYRPLSTFSVKDEKLIQTTIPQVGTVRNSFFPHDSFLDLGDHEITGPIRGLGLSEKPFMSRYYLERSGILPEGKVIETGVRTLDGFRGADKDGRHTIVYCET